MRENQRDNDTDRYELNRSIQASRRGDRTKTTGSKPIDQNGLPVRVLPTKPLSRINRTYEPTQTEPPTSSLCLENRQPPPSLARAVVRYRR
jgi:hypothetical protein